MSCLNFLLFGRNYLSTLVELAHLEAVQWVLQQSRKERDAVILAQNELKRNYKRERYESIAPSSLKNDQLSYLSLIEDSHSFDPYHHYRATASNRSTEPSKLIDLWVLTQNCFQKFRSKPLESQ